jgi:hypothetical protein
MNTQPAFMAVHSTEGTVSTLDGTLICHFDVSCAKCQEKYCVWGPSPQLEESLRLDRENWLKEHLPNVCPYHKDSFPLPSLEVG